MSESDSIDASVNLIQCQCESDSILPLFLTLTSSHPHLHADILETHLQTSRHPPQLHADIAEPSSLLAADFSFDFSPDSFSRLGGSDLLPWEAVLECYIWSDHFLHFCQRCRAQIGRFPSERKSYTL
ncbi:hypothetical protein L6452_32753 [Arctium lappa]|uniref:Uncharacterized protein n=1 Tax=Arctium lappa TaxID=4217 RepID=A0ACB8Z6E0_ARCLA|nr:hypothetical protein L6452_32753 [Arctium lappa]